MFWILILTSLVTSIQHVENAKVEVPLPPTGPPPGPQMEQDQPRCLTGHMTDVQGWVDEHGALTSSVDPHTTIDLSALQNITSSLTNQLTRNKSAVKFLSLARCKLNRVPDVFHIKDAQYRQIAETLEYVTMYGNSFADIGIPGGEYDVTFNATAAEELIMDYKKPVSTAWSIGFYKIKFPNLLELDLRHCSIETLSPNIFQEMPLLQALYLSYNNITTISSNAFFGLNNLIHLDLSRNFFNTDQEMTFQSENTFRALKRLRSLDLSYTKLTNANVRVFTRLGKRFESLSLCQTRIPNLDDCTFNGTTLKYIDLSGNYGIFKNRILKGTENTLNVLFATDVGLNTFEIFENFRKLEVLKLNRNEIPFLNHRVIQTLTSLKLLDLTNNRLTTWFNNLFTASTNLSLKYLSIKNNYINLITNEMMADFATIKYLSMSGNFIVCNCNARELYELALRNEKNASIDFSILNANENYVDKYTKLNYNTAFDYFNRKVINRSRVTRACDRNTFPCREFRGPLTVKGDYLLLDYDQASYNCMLPSEGQAISFYNMKTCQQANRDARDIDDILKGGRYELLTLIIIPVILFPLLIFAYIFRKNFKYCFVTMRNSALLSLINKADVIDDNTIFNYDVFVSYCNEDRNWVLDHLLPHVEKDCDVNVCLHERDFQVGLSILENIVSCMDRSRSIMLIISKQFLLSQWCQFEMHLAQHRLLETRREDLILILLEDIPRRARPTTLHYLMLTKTYIVWPKSQHEEAVFWRRLKKSLVTYRLRQPGNESLA